MTNGESFTIVVQPKINDMVKGQPFFIYEEELFPDIPLVVLSHADSYFSFVDKDFKIFIFIQN